jgi:hypothetical protein
VNYDEDTVCEYKFTYELDENRDTNLRIENKTCPPTNIAAISIIGVIIATFLIGLLVILLVKCNMYLADKREYAKFEKERLEHTQYLNQSPLYKSPISIYKNPNSPDKAPPNVFELK